MTEHFGERGAELSGLSLTVISSAYREEMVSGENLAVLSQTEALQDAGALLQFVERSTDLMQTQPAYRTMSALRVAAGIDIPRTPTIENSEPTDVLLVHNLFPNFGSRLVGRWRGPIVVMIHNYRYFCSNGLFFRDGEPCTKCIGGNSLPAMRYGCYRSSRLASFPLAVATWNSVLRNPILRHADQIVCQSQRSTSLFLEAGMDPTRLSTVTGFAPRKENRKSNSRPLIKTDRWLFVGRLTAEKGLLPLLNEWPSTESLDVVGDGPDGDLTAPLRSKRVNFLGRKSHEWVLENIDNYHGLIYPGLCFEGAVPMVVREAVSQGVPVLAARDTSASDFVSAHEVGTTYTPQTGELNLALDRMRENQDRYVQAALELSQTLLSRESWIERMAEVFDKASKGFELRSK